MKSPGCSQNPDFWRVAKARREKKASVCDENCQQYTWELQCRRGKSRLWATVATSERTKTNKRKMRKANRLSRTMDAIFDRSCLLLFKGSYRHFSFVIVCLLLSCTPTDQPNCIYISNDIFLKSISLHYTAYISLSLQSSAKMCPNNNLWHVLKWPKKGASEENIHHMGVLSLTVEPSQVPLWCQLFA